MSSEQDPHRRKKAPVREAFARMSQRVSRGAGHPLVFASAFTLVVAWALSGPFLGFSNTWQLAINTTTTVATFLMVFLIQSTQNRDTKAIHLKLDALIAGLKGPSNDLIDAEDLTEAELEDLEWHFRKLAEKVRDDAGGEAGEGRVTGAAGLLRKFHEESEEDDEPRGRPARA